jgi:hypothetical protein
MGDIKEQFPATLSYVVDPSSSEEDLNSTREHDAAFEKRVLRKVDLWLVGFYSFVYIFRVIDSSNYSNAAIINLEKGTGIKKQLHLDPAQWAWTLSIFSYSYLIFEPSVSHLEYTRIGQFITNETPLTLRLFRTLCC